MPGTAASRARKGSPPWRAVLVVLLVVAALIWAALAVGNPFPPRRLVMVTGPEGSAFREFGARYREALGREGITVELVTTEGGVENLARLNDPASGVAIGFVEGGLARNGEFRDLASLGTVTIEPLWLFLRPVAGEVRGVRWLEGKRIAIERGGSATRMLVRELLSLNGLDEKNVSLVALPPEQAADALLRGEVDVAMMLTGWQSPVVRRLLVADGVMLESFPRADAYVARSRYLYKVVLPTGVADLARNIPDADVPLLAVQASLVVRKDLHPALQYVLLEAAEAIHGVPDVFHRVGRFPAAEIVDLPLSAQATTWYKSGRPFIYSYFPLWLAGPVERLVIVLIPLFAVILPLAHFLPRIYSYLVEHRIFRLYGELKALELEVDALRPGASTVAVTAALDELAARANRLHVPIRYQQRLHILISHVVLARERAERHAAGLVTLPG